MAPYTAGAGGRDASSGARWARVRDLRALVVPLIATEPRASTLVIGPSQSGKTAGLAIPAILEAAGPVVAASVKRDLLDHALPARAIGKVWIYDPTGAARLGDAGLVGWDPVASRAEWAETRRMAHNLTSAQGASAGHDAEFWLQMAAKPIAPLPFAGAGKVGGSMRDVVGRIDSGEQRQVEEFLPRPRRAGCPRRLPGHLPPARNARSHRPTRGRARPFSEPAVLASTGLERRGRAPRDPGGRATAP